MCVSVFTLEVSQSTVVGTVGGGWVPNYWLHHGLRCYFKIYQTNKSSDTEYQLDVCGMYLVQSGDVGNDEIRMK